jgi:hypothetical protein
LPLQKPIILTVQFSPLADCVILDIINPLPNPLHYRYSHRVT